MPIVGVRGVNSLGFGGGNKYDPNTWVNKMLVSYFDNINTHFDSTSKSAYLPVLQSRLQPTYVDSSGTGYLYNTFGPSGQNKTVCDFIALFHSTIATFPARVVLKTGATLRWNCNDTIYIQNNLPLYSGGGASVFFTMSSTDGFTNISSIQLYQMSISYDFPVINSNMTGSFQIHAQNIVNIPILNYPSTTVRLYGNYKLNRVLKNHILQSCTEYNCGSMGIVALEGYSFLSVNIGTVLFSNNYMSTSNVDAFLNAINVYFSTHTPIKNLSLNLSGATMGIPTDGASNANIFALTTIFTNAGFVITTTVRTS